MTGSTIELYFQTQPFFWDKASPWLDWPQTCYVVEAVPEFLIFLPPPSECWVIVHTAAASFLWCWGLASSLSTELHSFFGCLGVLKTRLIWKYSSSCLYLPNGGGGGEQDKATTPNCNILMSNITNRKLYLNIRFSSIKMNFLYLPLISRKQFIEIKKPQKITRRTRRVFPTFLFGADQH